MTESIRLPAPTFKPSTTALPGSKNISNRTLLLAALSDNAYEIHSLLKPDDTDRVLEALDKLGVQIESLPEGRLKVHGTGGRLPNPTADLFLGNTGTAFRPLTAALAVLGGDYHLRGVPHMYERPTDDLVDALRIAGADVQYLNNENCPLLQIGKRQDNGERAIPIKGNVSSQFLTALLMALPLTGQAFEIHMVGELISKPYIDITLKLMAQFGVDITNEDYRVFKVLANAKYHTPEHLYVGGDASNASYFLGTGLIVDTPIRVTGIGTHNIQDDVAFACGLEKTGADVVWGENFVEISRPVERKVQAFDLDANHIPNAAVTLAIVALATKQPCILRNIGSWRVKETDRIAAMATELRKLDSDVIEETEAIHITPPETLTPDAVIDTYDGHHMVMCFSLVSLLGVPVIINDPKCTHKTFPEYFQVFASLAN